MAEHKEVIGPCTLILADSLRVLPTLDTGSVNAVITDPPYPNEKPLDLMCRLVRHVTRPGETVFDCFAGSAVTAVACIKTERKFIGIEKDEGYFNAGVARIRKAWAEENAPLYSEP